MIYAALTGTCLLAIISLWATAKYAPGNWWTRLALLAYACFVYYYGAWAFLGIWLGYVFAAAFVLLLLRQAAHAGHNRPDTVRARLKKAFITLLFGSLCVLYFTGTTGKPYGYAHLAPPFHRGNYFVLQGGKGLPTNLFHYKLRTAVHAMDIVKLNRWGNRANAVFSTTLTDYAIYNDTLLSPCNGKVISCESRNPDNIPPHRKRGYRYINYVLIASDSLYVFLGHLAPGGVLVKPGQVVHTGQAVGICGNSGFSIEPHLHIQAHANTHTGLPWYREPPLQILFNEKYYGLFDVIRVR